MYAAWMVDHNLCTQHGWYKVPTLEVIPEDNLLPPSKPCGLPADPLTSRSRRRRHQLHGRPTSLAPSTDTMNLPLTPMHDRWRPLESVSTTQVNIKNTVNGAEKEIIHRCPIQCHKCNRFSHKMKYCHIYNT